MPRGRRAAVDTTATVYVHERKVYEVLYRNFLELNNERKYLTNEEVREKVEKCLFDMVVAQQDEAEEVMA